MFVSKIIRMVRMTKIKIMWELNKKNFKFSESRFQDFKDITFEWYVLNGEKVVHPELT